MALEEAVRFFGEADADPSALASETVTVVGYGNLGRSMALNLRDSGVAVTVGNVDDAYRTAARRDGFAVGGISDAVADADIVYLLVPDEVMDDCYEHAVGPALRGGAGLTFASGYALAFGLVVPREDVDVLLLAPRMLGDEVRRTYEDGSGFFSYVSVEQDSTGRAFTRLLGLASAAGSLRRGAMSLSARDEAILDLFIEQGVGPYLGAALQAAFEIGTEAGLPPEALVLEMYMSGEMARTFQTFAEVGFYKSVARHGAVAQYGGFLRSVDLDHEAMHRRFRDILADIASGGFAHTFAREEAQDYPTLAAIEGITMGTDPMSQAEERVRRALGGA